jgi:hypothetical protein
MKTVNFDEGYATVWGRVMAYYWSKNYLDIIDVGVVQERDIYLIYGDHKSFDQRYRTNFNGVYEFSNLIKGNYTMFVYSEDTLGAPVMHPRIFRFKVDDQNQVLNVNNVKIDSIPDIYINIKP